MLLFTGYSIRYSDVSSWAKLYHLYHSYENSIPRLPPNKKRKSGGPLRAARTWLFVAAVPVSEASFQNKLTNDLSLPQKIRSSIKCTNYPFPFRQTRFSIKCTECRMLNNPSGEVWRETQGPTLMCRCANGVEGVPSNNSRRTLPRGLTAGHHRYNRGPLRSPRL